MSKDGGCEVSKLTSSAETTPNGVHTAIRVRAGGQDTLLGPADDGVGGRGAALADSLGPVDVVSGGHCGSCCVVMCWLDEITSRPSGPVYISVKTPRDRIQTLSE